MNRFLTLLAVAVLTMAAPQAGSQTWRADNGNGTYTNPLFYDEFSDPDLIRVGNDFYLTGTTMHTMPGLPVLHSRDLVNWEFMSYAVDRLDLGPKYRLDGGSIYGQGIWAPSFRYHAGTFHIFSNVNGESTQHFSATNPRGPWKRVAMKRAFHDLSVLFDDDGKVYVVWGYQDMHFAQLDSSLSDIVPGTERVLFAKDAGMGEGAHFYKIDGKYFILSAWYANRMRMPAARADRPEGPYEVNREISADETFGLREGNRMRGNGTGAELVMNPPNLLGTGHMSLHQGGIVQTPSGEWWGFSMMDANSVGRLTALSPVTWKDGWPYFGLPDNLGRTPRTWVKPAVKGRVAPSAPFSRNDEFSGPRLGNVWQWNHAPDDANWSLSERRGYLRLRATGAPDFFSARNSLTQRAVGPQSTAVTALDATGMRDGDVAGLALLGRPYAWIGVQRTADGMRIAQYGQLSDSTAVARSTSTRVWLRAESDFLTERTQFSYRTNGTSWKLLGSPMAMAFQLKTFQGMRFALFNYNAAGKPGGVADFDFMRVRESHPTGLIRAIPFVKRIRISAAARDVKFTVGGGETFTVVDDGLGRVRLQTGGKFVTVSLSGDQLGNSAGASAKAARDSVTREGATRDSATLDGEPHVALEARRNDKSQTFQWMETMHGDLVLMSLVNHRYLTLGADGVVTAGSRGPETDPANGTLLKWSVVLAPRR